MLVLLKRTFILVVPFLWKNRASRIATLTTLGIVLCNTLAHTASPWLFGQLIQYYATLDLVYVLLLIALLVFCWGTIFALNQWREVVFFRVINQAIRDIRMQVIMQLHKVPLSAWETYGVPEIISANTRVSMSLRNFMRVSFVTILPALFKIGTFSVAMLAINSALWYFPVLILLTYGYVYWGIRHFLQSRHKAWEATDQTRTAMDSSLHNTQFARFYLQSEQERLDPFFTIEAQRWLRNTVLQHKIHLVQDVLFFMVAAGVVVHTVLLLRAGQLTVPNLVVIKGYLFSVHSQMSQITGQSRSLFSSVIDFKKVLNLLALPNHPAHASLPAPSMKFSPQRPILEACNVSFSYEKDKKMILQNLSLAVYQGEKVAIIGTSGAGKSTLCHLMSGIYPPLQGKVLLNGLSMQQLTLSTIGCYVHFVAQEAIIMTGSIADNLMTDQKAVQTMPLAYLKDRLYESIGDQGKKLSSGEKQRILLARCLAYQPEVLILDETLSALDEENAQNLLKMMLAQVPTVILVTHRASLLKDFQVIYALEKGRLVAV